MMYLGRAGGGLLLEVGVGGGRGRRRGARGGGGGCRRAGRAAHLKRYEITCSEEQTTSTLMCAV